MIPLRPYQVRGREMVREEIGRGKRRVLIVLPTGGGKTVLAADIIKRTLDGGRKVLFVAHRRELIKQSYDKLIDVGIPEGNVGIIMRGLDRRPHAPVQVASIQTLVNRPTPPADVLFIDEAHRALAKSYVTLSDSLPGAVKLGLTATPWRGDGKGLCEAYDSLVSICTVKELIADGFLVAPQCYGAPGGTPDVSGVRIVRTVEGEDYDPRGLANACDQSGLVGDIVANWKARGGGRRTVVFAASVAHSQHIAERFRGAGVRAEHLDGTTPVRERDACLARLRAGDCTVVCNCDVLSEGWDMPEVKCCVLAKPTRSVTKYLQKVGRVLRPWRDETCVILDHAGCIPQFGFPQKDRSSEMTLGARQKRMSAERGPGVRICTECFLAYSSELAACPACGHAPVRGTGPDMMPEEAPGELVPLAEDADPLEGLRDRVNRLCKRCDIRFCGGKYGVHAMMLKKQTRVALRERTQESLEKCIDILETKLGIRKLEAL